MPSLSVNVDTVALVRDVRGATEPDPVHAVVIAELAGVDGVAMQLRPGFRAARERDLHMLKGIVKSRLNLEISPTDELIKKSQETKPDLVTFFADHATDPNTVSTIGFESSDIDYKDLVGRLQGLGINVGFFIEPDTEAVKKVSRAGASAVLISCTAYSNSPTITQLQHELDRIERAAAAAVKADLMVQAGRGVTYRNVGPLVDLGLIDEFVVGYAIAARSLMVGFEKAVRDMLALVRVETGQQ